jgi:hypothetical protein
MAEKVTIKQFGEKLGEYKSGSAARKAIGRFNGWSDEEKNKARKMIDAKFGTTELAKPVAKKAAKLKVKLAKVAPKAKVTRSAKPTRKATASPKGRSAPLAAVPVVAHPESDAEVLSTFGKAPQEGGGRRFIAERAVHVCAIIVANTAKVHEVQPSLDILSTLEGIVTVHNRALAIFAKELEGVSLVEEKVTRRGRPRTVSAEVPSKNNGKLESVITDDDTAAFAAPVPAAPQI